MRRRELILSLGGATLAWPPTTWAQQKAMPVIGFVSAFSPGPSAALVAGFRDGIAEAGYVEGLNLAIEYRWAEGRLERLPAMVQDLVERRPAVIVAVTQAAALAAKAATATIPIVFYSAADPVATGLVNSLARPGGNLTGLVSFAVALAPKLLQFLHELVPKAAKLALLIDPGAPFTGVQSSETQRAARAAEVELVVLRAGGEAELDSAFAGLTARGIGGLIVSASAFFFDHGGRIVAAAALHAVPAIYNNRSYAAAGGLMSYGNDLGDIHRRVGVYAGRILKGAQPADLPIQQPTRFELVINLKTANALGLTVPQTLLARADEVIE